MFRIICKYSTTFFRYISSTWQVSTLNIKYLMTIIIIKRYLLSLHIFYELNFVFLFFLLTTLSKSALDRSCIVCFPSKYSFCISVGFTSLTFCCSADLCAVFFRCQKKRRENCGEYVISLLNRAMDGEEKLMTFGW